MSRGRTGAGISSPLAARPERRRGPGRSVLGWCCLLVAVVAAGVMHARMSEFPFWTIASVEVEGNRSISTADLLDRLGLRPGVPWWEASPSAVRRVQREEPRIREVKLSWRWPRGLAVTVEERESLLRVPGVPSLEMSEDGVLMETREDLDPADLPLLTGRLPLEREPGRRLSERALKSGWGEMLDLCHRVSPLCKSISEIHCDEERIFQVFLRDGRKVILWEAGMNDDLKEQLPTVLGELREERIADAVLDLRFRDQLVVRRPASTVADSAAAGEQDGWGPGDEPVEERRRSRS